VILDLFEVVPLHSRLLALHQAPPGKSRVFIRLPLWLRSFAVRWPVRLRTAP
jgi:hypothetical protein